MFITGGPMVFFHSLHEKLKSWQGSHPRSFELTGLKVEHWNYFYFQEIHNGLDKSCIKNSQVLIFEDQDRAEDFANEMDARISQNHQTRILFYPGHEHSPYSGVIASEVQFLERLKVLSFLCQKNDTKFIIATTLEALGLKTVPPRFFSHAQTVQVDDIISPMELKKKCVHLGYQSTSSVEEPGTFSHKGEIFDLYPIDGEPTRIHYFDDLVESMYLIDPQSKKTLKDHPITKLSLVPGPLNLIQDDLVLALRENLPTPLPGHKNKFEVRKAIFQHLSDNQLFPNYVNYEGLFHNDSRSLYDYIRELNVTYILIDAEKISRNFLDFREEVLQDFSREQELIESDVVLPSPDRIYNFNFFQSIQENHHSLHVEPLKIFLEKDLGSNIDLENTVHLNISLAKNFLRDHVNPTLPRSEFISECLLFLEKFFKHSGRIIFCSYTENSREELKHLIELKNWGRDLLERTSFEIYRLEEGFFYDSEKTIIITDGDLFSIKKSKNNTKSAVDLDLFAEQLSTLKIGDYVIHSEYGVGEYLGLEALEIGGEKSDYLIIKYSENDKVYVPVYKLNVIQKHAEGEAGLKLDSLRTNKFQALKARAKTSVKTLAFDLLKLQAERELAKAYAFSPPEENYHDFEMAFPFDETADQMKAIQSVLDEMQKPRPMDFLVCGDVGFGKTEVAMRAAFKAVLDKKQVAVLVPTTILALQHYNSFVKRFKNFPVNIEFVSRFKSAKESKEIFQKTKEGKVDILIGTHKILSESLDFLDLGLVIVDEEQRFGVGHKEKMKLLKSSVDFLTLTATPIPRTLQLAFLGLRELALIKTAPPRRQSIKTYIIKEDEYTIQTAIKKELQRGGQVFIVHNKVQDMEQYVHFIRELVPEAKIIFAHGQMSEKDLEERVTAFYNGQYQILIATTIIESGIDIPNANTMIIDRADTFGLAQLHQLRGRIGRSDKKAYAYFIVPRLKEVSTIASKRLHALQTYAEMGAGFNLATVDLEIRGAGDILGATQSGHIEAVGLELYMELLKEAISEIKGERRLMKKDIEIQTPFEAFIPNKYIQDATERLKTYKRLSNCENLDQLLLIKEELEDVFGIFPMELSNLFHLIEVRIHLQSSGVKNVNVLGKTIIVKFDPKVFESYPALRDQIIQFFISRPKIYQFTPDFKVVYNLKDTVTQKDLLAFAKEVSKLSA